MRALRVLGIAENGTQVVCQPVADEDTPVSAAETFALPVDERLRAAVRGDLTRIGQLEIEMESQLRPREIQQRIRAGSTVEQVAAAAGCSPEKIERYAYPVLLERTTIAERARLAHPMVDGAPSSRSVADIVAETLAARGQQATISWDAFRDERGWALRASWKAGRSENRAIWTYHAGPAGGTVIPRDESASMLIDPAQRTLRTVGTDPAGSHPSASPRGAGDPTQRNAPAAAQRSDRSSEDSDLPVDTAPVDAGEDRDELSQQHRMVADTVTDTRSGSRSAAQRGEAIRTAADATLRVGTGERARDTGTDGPATPVGQIKSGMGGTSATAGATNAAGVTRTKRGQRPQMPSWEDVLLGTRR